MTRSRRAGAIQAVVVVAACAYLARTWCAPGRPVTVKNPRRTLRMAIASDIEEAGTESKEERWQRFSDWMAARGANMEKVKIANVNGMRGLVAAQDIAENESIVEIPLGASIDITDPRNDKDPSLNALALLRLLDDADLAPYMDLLPGRDSSDIMRMPDFYSDEELQMLQCPEVIEKTRRRRELCAHAASESSLETDSVKWALCTVAQRAFLLVSPIDGLLRLLLPGIDLFNHDAHALHTMKVRWNLEGYVDAVFKVIAGSPIKKGEEIRICYGGSPFRPDGCGGDCIGDMALTNAQYLMRYGFVDDCMGTTMVDGKWLVKTDAERIRESLVETTVAEDDQLLSDSSLPLSAQTAVEFRRHLKIALKAQQEADAMAAKAEAAKSEEQKQAEAVAKAKAEEEASIKEANAAEARKQLLEALEEKS